MLPECGNIRAATDAWWVTRKDKREASSDGTRGLRVISTER
jgi:hypothetical protein